jgi:hypothetical protein
VSFTQEAAMPEVFIEVESFKFTDIVTHWGRERLVHELLVARELARGVVHEGLRLQSVDPKWTSATTVLRAEPLVGYAARQATPPIMIRATALEQLCAIAAERRDFDPYLLCDEFVAKDDFRKWLVLSGRVLPAFWFAAHERARVHKL